MRLRSLGVAGALSLLVVGAAQAADVHFAAKLKGAAEVPSNTSAGTGELTAFFDVGSKMLTYHVDYSGLSGPATAAHFHGPAAPGSNAPAVIPMESLSSPMTGMTTITDAQAADLMAGKWYFNIHTAKIPGGEIRGQVEKVK